MVASDGTLKWIVNFSLAEALYWQKRGEWDPDGTLEAAVFRKRYMARWYDTSRVYIDAPKSSKPGQSEQSLRADGLIGIYAHRKAPSDQA